MEKDVKIYQNFEGTPLGAIPKLLSQGYYPVSVKDVLALRLEKYNTSEKNTWFESTFTTSVACLYNLNGSIKIVFETNNILKNIDTIIDEEKRSSMVKESFSKLEGELISKTLVNRNTSRSPLDYEKIKKNPIWNALVDDKHLLSEYAKLIASECKRPRCMGVFAKDEIKVTYDLRFAIVHKISGEEDFHKYFSDVDLRAAPENVKNNILACKTVRQNGTPLNIPSITIPQYQLRIQKIKS